MKKIILLSSFIFLLLLTGCGNKTVNQDTQQDSKPLIPEKAIIVTSTQSEITPSQNNIPSDSPIGNLPKIKSYTIIIDNFTFDPTTVTIKAGENINWLNDDQATHTIKSDLFTSPELNTGDSFAYRFTEPGTYKYICSIHPSMEGTIIVE